MKWLRKIISDVVRSELTNHIKNEGKIISYRAPDENDIYQKGCRWQEDDMAGKNRTTYLCTKVVATWEKISPIEEQRLTQLRDINSPSIKKGLEEKE